MTLCRRADESYCVSGSSERMFRWHQRVCLTDVLVVLKILRAAPQGRGEIYGLSEMDVCNLERGLAERTQFQSES